MPALAYLALAPLAEGYLGADIHCGRCDRDPAEQYVDVGTGEPGCFAPKRPAYTPTSAEAYEYS